MKYLRLFHLSLVMALTALAGGAQDVPLTQFVPTDTPATWSPAWYELNNANNNFLVSVTAGSLHVARGVGESNVTEMEISQGSLLGVNMGEWGGGLFYKPADSLHPSFFVNGHPGPSQKTFFGGLMIPPSNPLNQRLKGYSLVVNGQVSDIFRYKDSIFFLEGLAHMGLLYGGLYSLRVKADSFVVARVADFKDCPSARLVDGPRLWVATDGGLLLMENGTVVWIFRHIFWSGLYPTSVARDSEGMVYVGLRGGYVKIDPVGKKLIFYKWSAARPAN